MQSLRSIKCILGQDPVTQIHQDSYHALHHNKQTNTTNSCIRNMNIDICIGTPSKEFPQELVVQGLGEVPQRHLHYATNLMLSQLGSLLYFHCPFYFMETIALTDTKNIGSTWNFMMQSLTPMESALTQPRQNINTCQFTSEFTCQILCGQHTSEFTCQILCGQNSY